MDGKFMKRFESFRNSLDSLAEARGWIRAGRVSGRDKENRTVCAFWRIRAEGKTDGRLDCLRVRTEEKIW